MEKKKVLFITHEMAPYIETGVISEIMTKLPKKVQDRGNEIRILMPRFGTINERKHKLHEVIRLSGMNIVVNDEDYPLILKVASYPGMRMQVYFLDNDEFFHRKFLFHDETGQPFEDNVHRMVFFSKAAMETVRKFGWPPDIVHASGWMSALIPFYVKKVYHDDPIFTHAKVVYTIDNPTLEETFDESFFEIAAINGIDPDELNAYRQANKISLHQGAIHHSDAIIKAQDPLRDELEELVKNSGLPVMTHKGLEDEQIEEYLHFYESILEEEKIEEH